MTREEAIRNAEHTITIEHPDDPMDLHCHYTGQTSPQAVYLEIDGRDRAARIDYSAEIGNAVPISVWHSRTIRFLLPGVLTLRAIERMQRDLGTTIALLLDSYIESMDDQSNWIGYWGDLRCDPIERWIDRLDPTDLLQIWPCDEWINDDVGITAESTDDDLSQIANDLIDLALDDDIRLTDVIECLEHIREEKQS